MKFKQLILITGVERSGSTLISRVLQLCEANTGQTNKMRENITLRALSDFVINDLREGCFMPTYQSMETVLSWEKSVIECLKNQNIPESMPFLYKDSQITQLWKLWHNAYPTAKWIIVRRRTGDILNSLHETAYMVKFKNKKNIERVGATNEQEAWLWWVHEYENRFRDIIASGVDHRIVWPERMRDGDFEQMKEVVSWCGLKWNDEVEDLMKLLLNTK